MSIKIIEQSQEVVAKGLASKFCENALVHIGKKNANDYHLCIMAYLPVLEQGKPPVQVQVSNIGQRVKTESGDLDARLVDVIYTSTAESTGPYNVWEFNILYQIESGPSYPAINVKLKNLDPETSRGTVTTAEDTDPENNKE